MNDFGIEIALYRKSAGLDKLDHDREAVDRPIMLYGESIRLSQL